MRYQILEIWLHDFVMSTNVANTYFGNQNIELHTSEY